MPNSGYECTKCNRTFSIDVYSKSVFCPACGMHLLPRAHTSKEGKIEELTEEEWRNLPETGEIPEGKEEFKERFKELVIKWLAERTKELVDVIIGKNEAAIWEGKNYREIREERNMIEMKIRKSREKNRGGIDKQLAIEILQWGGISMDHFSERSTHNAEIGNTKFILLTRDVFELADDGKYHEAAYELMKRVNGIGISRATKLIGLSDQDKLCIYDSRVGHYLSDLKIGCTKLILHPPGKTPCPKSDPRSDQQAWARNYERLIWVLEIARDYLSNKIGQIRDLCELRIADVELAFFALGKC